MSDYFPTPYHAGRPIVRHTERGDLGNAVAAAESIGLTVDTWTSYVRARRPVGNPPPEHVTLDPETGQKLWELAAVRAWQQSRTGRGNPGAVGTQTCPRCGRTVPVKIDGQMYRHRREARFDAPECLPDGA